MSNKIIECPVIMILGVSSHTSDGFSVLYETEDGGVGYRSFYVDGPFFSMMKFKDPDEIKSGVGTISFEVEDKIVSINNITKTIFKGLQISRDAYNTINRGERK